MKIVFVLVNANQDAAAAVQPLAVEFIQRHGLPALRSAGIAASTTKAMRDWIESGDAFESAQAAAAATMQRGMGWGMVAVKREAIMNALQAEFQ